MYFALIIGALILIGFIVLFMLVKEIPKIIRDKQMEKNRRVFQMKRINSISDGCPICGGTLVYSDDNIQLRPQAFFKKYYCVQCEMNTAIIVRKQDD